jgi:PiT family inorganic phosphate transporter
MWYESAWGSLSAHQILLLVAALAIAFGFEFVNGFHDTANAVATVIYTKSLKPHKAVAWSGLWNFLGVHAGGIGVAYSIVNLLPVDLLASIEGTAGLLMVLAILVAAAAWNLGTWYLGLPASSSHTLIGSILGVGLTHSLLSGHGLAGINWTKAAEVGLSLLLSPLIGFGLAAVLLLLAKRSFPDPKLHAAPEGDTPPPTWVRALLIGTCTGVSFAHGSNDGQKGMGLIMLILIGIMPAHYALNLAGGRGDFGALSRSIGSAERWLADPGLPAVLRQQAEQDDLAARLRALAADLEGGGSFAELDTAKRWDVRSRLLGLGRDLKHLEQVARDQHLRGPRDRVAALRKQLVRPIEYVPEWVKMGVALALGIGTCVGWKRIVVTVAEKIGKEHLTYSQGACAELVAMSTIGLADLGGLPVSTTHVLSSGIAGTMWANRSGVELTTIRKIALAWVLTLPAAMLLSSGLFLLGQAAIV